jgi:hypothetical protein
MTDQPLNIMQSHHLDTLRRVPDDVILAVASRELGMHDSNACLCGWIVREAVARLADCAPEDVYVYDDRTVRLTGEDTVLRSCVKLFGGDRRAWRDIFVGTTMSDRLPDIEVAFTQRVAEAARRK